jgi:hypothetical protein
MGAEYYCCTSPLILVTVFDGLCSGRDRWELTGRHARDLERKRGELNRDENMLRQSLLSKLLEIPARDPGSPRESD